MYDIKQEVCQIIYNASLSKYNNIYFENILSYILRSNYFSELKSLDIAHCKHRLQKLEIELAQGRPIQYCLNEAYFMDLVLSVDERVLIPRPETEELTDWLIKDIKNWNSPKILDVGTGSGCIAIQIAKSYPQAQVMAWDVSSDALQLAQENAMKYLVHINFKKIDFLNFDAALELKWDAIITNPPYISEADSVYMDDSVIRFEPHQALFAKGTDPDIFYRKLANFGKNHLVEGGMIYCELNQYRSMEIIEIFKQEGYTQFELRKDLQGNERMLRLCNNF